LSRPWQCFFLHGTGTENDKVIFWFIGLLLGYLVIKNRQALLDLFASWGFDPFPADFNGFDGLPAIMRPEEFIGVFCFAFIMCVVATLIPAIAASRSDAAKSLRNM